MPRKTHLAALLFVTVLIFAALPSLAAAGSFRAVPVRLYLDARTKTAVLKVANDGDEKVTVQLEAISWSQGSDGKDVYSPTKDIVFFPKIADIEKGQEKIIRIGYEGQKGASIASEKTYRLMLQELPVSKPGEVAIKMAIRMGLPVFVTPEMAVKEGAVDKVALSDGSVAVSVKNTGNSHISISRIKAKGFDAAGAEVFSAETPGWYVLAGRTRVFGVDMAREDCLRTQEIKVEAEAEKAIYSSTLIVDRQLCADKPKPVVQERGEHGRQESK